MIKSAVVTGANGFIGRHLIEELLDRNVEVSAVMRNPITDSLCLRGGRENLKIIIFDYREMAQLKNELPEECDACFNLAWGGVSGAGRSDYKIQLDNVERAAGLMKVLSEMKCKRFIGAGSVSEMEAALYMPLDGAAGGGRLIYSIAKQASHYMNKCLSQMWGIDYINASIANTYGEHGSDSLILHDTIIKLLRKMPTSFTSGHQTYDFLYVKDVVDGLILLAEKGRKNCSYYIGSGRARSLKCYLEEVRDIIDPSLELGFGLREQEGMGLPEEIFDIGKIRRDTGFCPGHTFESSIKGVVGYYAKKSREG